MRTRVAGDIIAHNNGIVKKERKKEREFVASFVPFQSLVTPMPIIFPHFLFVCSFFFFFLLIILLPGGFVSALGDMAWAVQSFDSIESSPLSLSRQRLR